MGKGKDKGKKDKSRKAETGVRIPKPLRKAGKEALKLAREPVVTEIVAAALLSAAAALRGDKAGKAAAAGAADAGRQAGRIGDSLRILAIDLAKRTLDNWDRPAPAKAGEKTGSGKGKKGRGGGGSSKSAG